VDIIKELLQLTVGYDDTGFEPLRIAIIGTEQMHNPFATEIISTGIEI